MPATRARTNDISLAELRDMMLIGMRASLQLSEGNLRTVVMLTAAQDE